MSTIGEDWDTRVPSLEELKKSAKKLQNLKGSLVQAPEDKCRCGAPAATTAIDATGTATEQGTAAQVQKQAQAQTNRQEPMPQELT